MNSPYLSDDCIYDILKFLQDDHSTLFNCLLVNRFWCKETIPLLYVNPFEYVINDATNKYLIIFTLILCFDKAEISRFKNQLNQFNIKTYIKDEKEPLFDYPKYLENYYCLTVNNIINEWFKNYLNLPSNHEIVKNFIPTFHHSILRYAINIKKFEIPLHSFYKKNYNVQNFTQNLTKLNSLGLQDINIVINDLAQEFLKSIANICLNLKKLEISSLAQTISEETKENLCTIVQKQDKFRAFKISRCEFLLNDIFLSLEFQKHSLVYIEFEEIKFSKISLKKFINLYNLKYLNFTNCKALLIEQCDILKFSSFKLKELTLNNNTWKQNITLSLIEYLGESLQKLHFVGNITIPIIDHLSTYCLNLNSLKIRITPEIDFSIFPYFKNLRISKLILHINNRTSRNRFTDNITENLTKNFIPINTKEISIFFYYNNFHDLEAFLENCHHSLETINLSINNNLENLKIILNYIEKNNDNKLKLLGMKKLERMLRDEETILLDQIKARGVKFVDFSSIYHECSPLIYNSF
jgi:hypothetical protein